MSVARDVSGMDLLSTPGTLSCSECGAEIEDAGYLPATERASGYEPLAERAVCGACGFNEVGMRGCAPELDELTDPAPDDVLLYVQVTDAGLEPSLAKE